MGINLQQIIEFLLPVFSGGTLGTLLGMQLKRKKEKNSFLNDMQKSIDLLTTTNKELFTELIEVKRQNVELLANQKQLQLEISYLRDENTKFAQLLEKLGHKPGRSKKKTESERD